jgi:hypothetical protein
LDGLGTIKFKSIISVARPNQSQQRPVELGVQLSRRARRLLGSTGAVHKNVANLENAAIQAARKIWDSCEDRQIIVWLDNWYRKRFGTDPRQTDMSLNVSVLAVLHIPEIPIFPGFKSLGEILSGIPGVSQELSRVAARLCSGVTAIAEEDLGPSLIRVPLDIHRDGIRSLQWTPYLLTELTVSSQADLLSILHDLDEMQRHTRRPLPLLVDMDIHYRVMKLVYGVSTSGFNMALKMNQVPVLYGVYFKCN